MTTIAAFFLCSLFLANLPSEELVDGFYQLSNQTIIENDPTTAIVEYTKAIESTPDNLTLFLLRGAAFEKLNLFEKASNDFDYVINHPDVKIFQLIYALAGKIRIYTLENDFESCEKVYAWLNDLENKFFLELNNQIDSVNPFDNIFGFCEVCNSPIEIIETEKGVTLRCSCEK